MMQQDHPIVTIMRSAGIIPLYSNSDIGLMRNVLQSCHKAGVNVFEFTNRLPNALQIFSELVQYKNTLAGFHLGVGTVMDSDTTLRYIEAGAEYIISPIIKPEMGRICAQENIPWIPGCATITEIVQAMDNGAAMVKVFPGAVLGPKFVASIRPVVPRVPLMITGGVEVTEENLGAWFKAGADCVGLGSNLFAESLVSTGNWSATQENILKAKTLADKVRRSY
jgi:2-dehydro-3-deoxyphosphogluconate aldolase / (4S)-4-hydroxy-2-oxoglutarate aldolase